MVAYCSTNGARDIPESADSNARFENVLSLPRPGKRDGTLYCYFGGNRRFHHYARCRPWSRFSRVLVAARAVSNKGKNAVLGSRFMDWQPHRVVYCRHALEIWVHTTMSNISTNINLIDMDTCAKASLRDIIQSFKSKKTVSELSPKWRRKFPKWAVRVMRPAYPDTEDIDV